MTEQKRYTADELREASGRVVSELYTNPFADMLRQAADAEEEREANEKVKWSTDKSVRDERDRLIAENAQLKARLEAIVKIASNNSWCEDSGVVETNTCAKLHNSYMSDILHAARGEYDDDNHSSYTDDIYNS